MDSTGSATVAERELESFCNNFEYTRSVKRLFQCLDVHDRRFLVVGDLDFLQRWQGERFNEKNALEFRVSLARKALLYAEKCRARARLARQHSKLSSKASTLDEL